MWIILIIYLCILSIYLRTKIKRKSNKIYINKDKTSLFLTLGTKIGVGSIIGTTSSIIIGGFSSVLWIIIFSILTTSIIHFESYYGYKYRQKNKNDFVGGTYFILKYGLNKEILSIISVILLIIIYSFLFQMIQMNTISYIFINKLYISKYILVIISIIILFITTTLSIKDILSVINKIVPIMCLMFLIVSIIIIVLNINNMNFNILFKDFYSFKSIFSGLIIGVKRSIFMNELLIGTTSTSASSDNNDIDVSIKYQKISVYFIAIVITILISLLLLSYISINDIEYDYNTLIYNVYEFSLGKIGSYFLMTIFILFGFTTILSGYYIGKNNIEYITNNKLILYTFKILFILIATLGILFKNKFIWNLLDIFIFIMILINSYSIIKLVGSEKNDRKRLG